MPQTRFTPTQKIRIDPMRERSAMEEKAHPFPMEQVIMATMIKSRTDFTARVG